MDWVALRKCMIQAAGPDTAYDPSGYQQGTLSEHCGAVAYTIYSMYGGEIVTARVQGFRHFWNILPNGEEVDLSSDQYVGGDGFTPMAKGRPLPTRKGVNLRHHRFAARVRTILAEQ